MNREFLERMKEPEEDTFWNIIVALISAAVLLGSWWVISIIVLAAFGG